MDLQVSEMTQLLTTLNNERLNLGREGRMQSQQVIQGKEILARLDKSKPLVIRDREVNLETLKKLEQLGYKVSRIVITK